MRSKTLTYLPALDGIRGVAVLVVFFYHAFHWLGVPGWLGVDVFFVISGWLITRILIKERVKNGRINLGRFYLKRFLRLYPALLTMVAVVTFVMLGLGILVPTLLSDAVVALSYTSNIAMSYFGTYMMPFRHTWSLATEEQFYLLWPLILVALFAFKLSNRTLAILTGGLAVAGFMLKITLATVEYSPLANTSALLVGCAAAFVVADKPWQSTPLAYLGVAAMLVSIAGHMLGLVSNFAVAAVVILSTPFLIFHAASGKGPLVWCLSRPWLVYVGVVSYGIYLWHYPILFILRTSTDLSGGALGAVAVVLTGIATVLSHKFVETPFNALKDQIGTRQTARDAGPFCSDRTGPHNGVDVLDEQGAAQVPPRRDDVSLGGRHSPG
ncbi:acyltransferase family protein [Microterricola viridarii]|uniref:Acyltransferase 3 domain-containing protein n=1 Tax=Microterricola viridarii TaxID=412690 RepID=A0A0X8E5T9_9MICO|nr:acyltransferase [Microterricola viridarii]AMB59586.1 hypothetical protein AWU67_12710 [Microterricola viridarii]